MECNDRKGCTEKSHFTLKSGSFQTGKHIYNMGGTGHCLYTDTTVVQIQYT